MELIDCIRLVRIIFMVVIILCMGFFVFVEYERYERLEMYNIPFYAPFIYENGYYAADKYYCVWTEGRYYKDVLATERHEIRHSLIDEGEKEHFCE